MPDREQLIGSWALESVELLRDGRPTGATPFGARPSGMLHYLPDGRMVVLIAHDGRVPMAGDRQSASDAEWAKAARSFTGYAGTWDVVGDHVVHHVDINSYQNEAGADYPRIARLENDRLSLATPPDLPADQRAMLLVWRRYR
jgi:hypothetical protein